MKLYTPGERYVTLGCLIRTFLECAIIVVLIISASLAVERGAYVGAALLGAMAAVSLTLTLVLAALRVRR